MTSGTDARVSQCRSFSLVRDAVKEQTGKSAVVGQRAMGT
jgi:hypothetical protein